MTTSEKHLPHFETQTLDEEVIILERAHFFTNVWWIILVIIFIFIPPVLKLVPLEGGIPFDFSLSGDTQFILTLSWYLFVFAYAFQRFLRWYFNIYIVTNKRVVDIDFVNLFYKQISSTIISNIQDVTHRRGGVAQLFLNYGDVFIQTAGTNPNFEFHLVGNPNRISKKLISILHLHKSGHGGKKHGPLIGFGYKFII